MWRARAPLSLADGADEAAVFAAAMEATISGAIVDASEDDCTNLSRRRNLLQAGSAELDFTVTVAGTDAATTGVEGDPANCTSFFQLDRDHHFFP